MSEVWLSSSLGVFVLVLFVGGLVQLVYCILGGK